MDRFCPSPSVTLTHPGSDISRTGEEYVEIGSVPDNYRYIEITTQSCSYHPSDEETDEDDEVTVIGEPVEPDLVGAFEEVQRRLAKRRGVTAGAWQGPPQQSKNASPNSLRTSLMSERQQEPSNSRALPPPSENANNSRRLPSRNRGKRPPPSQPASKNLKRSSCDAPPMSVLEPLPPLPPLTPSWPISKFTYHRQMVELHSRRQEVHDLRDEVDRLRDRVHHLTQAAQTTTKKGTLRALTVLEGTLLPGQGARIVWVDEAGVRPGP